MTAWPDLERTLMARAGWKRTGRRGPCPVTGTGTDTAWFEPGRLAIIGGCGHCAGGPLTREAFRDHLQAVTGEDTRSAPFPGRRPESPGRGAFVPPERFSQACGPSPGSRLASVRPCGNGN